MPPYQVNLAPKSTTKRNKVKRKPGRERLSGPILSLRGTKLAHLEARRSAIAEGPKFEPRQFPEPLTQIICGLPNYNPYDQGQDYKFDEPAAARAVHWIEANCHHSKGHTAQTLVVLEPWEIAVIANLFGWVHKKTGYRRYRTAFVYVAKKSGKTFLCACVLMYLIAVDDEFGAELYSAACNREQASLVYEHCVGVIKQNPELELSLGVYGGRGGGIQRSIVNEATMSSYKTLAAGADSADGVNVHFAAIDEVHRHKTPELARVLAQSTAARTQPLLFYTSTADVNRPSLCNQLVSQSRSVIQNKGQRKQHGYDPTFLPVMYEAQPEDDWRSPKTWAKANPNLGVTVMPEWFEREVRRCEEQPSELNTFKRLHLNIVTNADVAWLSTDAWDRGDRPLPDLQHAKCWCGLDLATTTDIAAMVMLFPLFSGEVAILPRFWVPQDNIHVRQHRDKVPYQHWVDQGFVRATAGSVIDYRVIRADIKKDAEQFDIQEIGIDPWNSSAIATDLQDDGFHVVTFGQGIATMTSPSKELERLVMSSMLIHGGDPVLRWQASNVMLEDDSSGNIKPSKKKSTDRIDGIVAAIIAIGRYLVSEDPDSVYEDRGMLTV